MRHQPPRLARKFFQTFSGSANVEDLLGDLDEWFYSNLETKSLFRARLLYWKQVLSLTFSYALKKRKRDASFGAYATPVLSFDMLKNYVKVAVRNLYQHKYFSFLNAFGLAIGMSISLLLISMVSYVSTYDNFHLQKENIYTITSHISEGLDEDANAIAPALLADRIKNEFTGADKVVKIVRTFDNFVKTHKENVEVRSYFVEPDFFSVFTYNIVRGTAQSLGKPNTVILTESAVKKIFNEEDVMGKTIELSGGQVFEVAGVMEDDRMNSHFNFEMLLSYSSLPASTQSVYQQWTEFPGQYIYVLLQDKASKERLADFMNKVSSEIYAKTPTKVRYDMLQLEEIAMGPDLRWAIGTKWEISGFLIFGVFAALILLPACFNYTNISIARGMTRAKEIGLRKTLGGVNKQIFIQFITETVVITLVSFVGALIIFMVIRGEFQSMLVAASRLDLSVTWRTAALFIGFALFAGFLAGIFPALHFARLNPMQALKSKVSGRGGSMAVRKALTVFQFALSFGFILCLVVFSKQYRYSLNFDFGFEKENIVNVDLQDVKYEQFRTAYSGLASVKSISFSSGLPGLGASGTWISSGPNDSTEIAQQFIDHHYIRSFGLQFLAGRNFPDEPWQRERYLIVNEEFVRYYKLGNPIDALGKTFVVEGKELEVIGVLKNFHYQTLNYPIDKFMFRMDPAQYVYANMQVASTDAFQMFTQMENTWKQLPTEKKFIGNYFRDELNEAYSSYRVLIKIVGFLGLLAITISLLGMLGMVVYTAETKTKEVSIRKVMGATVTSITLLLSKDYLKMMAIAIVLSVPLTAFVLGKMLPQIQYYSVTLSVWDILISTLILVVLGLLTITSQTYKTATANPATTLRSE